MLAFSWQKEMVGFQVGITFGLVEKDLASGYLYKYFIGSIVFEVNLYICMWNKVFGRMFFQISNDMV